MVASLEHSRHMSDPTIDDLPRRLLSLAEGHTTRSQVYKPDVALLGDFLTRVPKSDMDRTYEASDNDEVLPLRFHITSDGERALVSYEGIGP